jgi:protein tyrosine/serine phosphatase
VVAETSVGKNVYAAGDFVTKESPRMMKIDGAVNVRDIGGWTTVDGRVIKQGLLYRGSEIDGAVEPKYCITEKGKNDMLSVLKIRSEVDLRSKELTPDGKDALGENVEHTYYGISMYSDVLNDSANDEKIRSIFSYLADVYHYPVYMHCTYGRDRTGTVCYLLEALLGLSDSNLEKEYELTAFYDGYTNVKDFTKFVGEIEDIEGDSTKEKVENYLLSIGVTAEEIESIRNIFLEDVKST